MLLIYPPSVRTTEPPLGAARLAGLLRDRGLSVRAVDLCAESLDWLLRLPPEQVPAVDTWTRLALRRRGRHASFLRSPAGYERAERYERAVSDLGRALGAVSSALAEGVEAGLADYRDAGLSPLRRADLLRASSAFSANPFFPFFSARLDGLLAETGAGTVGLSVNFLSQALCAFAIAGYLRAAHPEKGLVLGGGLVTSWAALGRVAPGDTFGGLFDAVIPGSGEGLLSFLTAAAGPGRQSAPPVPDFSDFDFGRYFAPSRIVPYNFSWGCPWNRCTFCPEKAEGGAYRPVRRDDAVAQVRSLADAWNPGLFHFTDNEIAPAYLRALSLNPPGAPWYGFARFSAELAVPAFCRALAASGCRMLQLGLESGDQAVLDSMDKGTQVERNRRILGNLKDAGIGVYAYVLFGTPGENRDAALRTRDFVASEADRIDFINVAVFNMPAFSAEAARLKTRSFYEGDLSLYTEFEHPAGWNRDSVRSFLSKDFESDPRIKPILRRNPPVFTSNHAPFFLR